MFFSPLFSSIFLSLFYCFFMWQSFAFSCFRREKKGSGENLSSHHVILLQVHNWFQNRLQDFPKIEKRMTEIPKACTSNKTQESSQVPEGNFIYAFLSNVLEGKVSQL